MFVCLARFFSSSVTAAIEEKQWAQMSRHKEKRRNVHAARADNDARAGRAVSPDVFPASLYIMRDAALLSHSARSCCSIGESNFVAMF